MLTCVKDDDDVVVVVVGGDDEYDDSMCFVADAFVNVAGEGQCCFCCW